MKQIVKSIVESSVRVLPFKKLVFGTIKPIHPPKKIWSLLRFKGTFDVAVDKKLSFGMHHYGYSLENSIFWRGLFRGFGEEEPLRLWIKLCTQVSTILDVGANMGIYSLVAKTISPQTEVYGFEPVAHLYTKFAENCKLNGYDITCVHSALSDVDGFTEIYIQPGGLTTASLNPHTLRTESERIETMTIASFIESNEIEKVDLMKIDVEGYEPQVLKGMGKYLAAMKPTMIIEILTEKVGEQVEALVKDCGYLFFNIDEGRGPLRQGSLSIVGKSRHSRNFLLCQEPIAAHLNLLSQHLPD